MFVQLNKRLNSTNASRRLKKKPGTFRFYVASCMSATVVQHLSLIRTVATRCRVRDQERDREKRDKKKLRDEETARVLAIQVQKLCDQRDADRADRAIVAQQYRSDAEALVRAEAAARMAKVESKKAVQEELNKQLALKV